MNIFSSNLVQIQLDFMVMYILQISPARCYEVMGTVAFIHASVYQEKQIGFVWNQEIIANPSTNVPDSTQPKRTY